MTTTENTLTLSPAVLARLQQAVAQHGVNAEAYVEKLLATTLENENLSDTDDKPYSVMDFYGAATSGRSAAEIDAEINALRDEWDTPEHQHSGQEQGGTDILEFLAALPQSPTPRGFASWEEYEAFLRQEKPDSAK